MSWQTTASEDCVSLERPPGGGDDRINCLGGSCAAPVVCISEVPFEKPSASPSPTAFQYFEITLLEGSSVILGLVGKFHDHDGGGIPGKRQNSIGFFSNGDLLCNVVGNECDLPFSSPFGQLDTIGIGMELVPKSHLVRAFATHNGRDLGTVLTTEMERFPFFPVIAFEDSFVIVTIRRTPPFLFDRRKRRVPPPPPPPLTVPKLESSSSSEHWHTAVKTAGSVMGRKLSQFFVPPASQTLEDDLLETQEHIDLLAGVLAQQNEHAQRELLLELTVSCRRLLVRHQNLIREAADDASLKKILEMNDHIVELLLSADRVLDNNSCSSGASTPTAQAAGMFKVLGPQHSEGSLMEKGTSIKVLEMLHMLRSGTVRSQKNAAASLAVFVKEELSRDLVVVNGGVHYLVVMSTKEDAELAVLVTNTLAELTSRIRMRKDQESESSFFLDRSVFRAELTGVLRAFEAWGDNSQDDLLVAQAIANLVLLSVINKPMDEVGVAILLNILQTSESIEARRVAAFGVALLVQKAPKSRTSVVSQYRFFQTLPALLQQSQPQQRDAELLLYAVCCLAGLLAECPRSEGEGEGEEEDKFVQGFITARVLHSKHHILPSLMALCEQQDELELDHQVRGYLVQCLHLIVLHPSGLLALLEEISPQRLIDTLLTLAAKLVGTHRLRGKDSSGGGSSGRSSSGGGGSGGGIMDESSFFYSARFQDSYNACEQKTRRQVLAHVGFSAIGAVSKTLHQVLMIVSADCGVIKFTEAQIQTVNLMSKAQEEGEEQVMVHVVSLLCSKFHVEHHAVLLRTSLLDLMRAEPTRLCAVREIAKLCNHPLFASKLFVCDYASHLCPYASSSDPELASHIGVALYGLAKVCFTTPQDGLFGFEPDGPVLAMLLGAVKGFDANPLFAAKACKVLALQVRSCGALSVHYRAAVLGQISQSVNQMCSRCALDEGRRAAEELFQVCGFSFGTFQVVANEALAIQSWASLRVELELYQAILDCVLFPPHRRGGGKSNWFFDPQVNERHRQVLKARLQRKSSLDLKSVVSDLKQSPPSKWMQLVASNFGQSSSPSSSLAGSSSNCVGVGGGGEMNIAKRLFKAFVLGCDQANVLDLYSACFAVYDLWESRFKDDGEEEEEEDWNEALCPILQDLFDHVYLNIGPLERYLGLYAQQQNYRRRKPATARTRILRFKSRIYFWTLPLVSTVLGEQVALKATEGNVKFTLVLQAGELFTDREEKDLLVEMFQSNSALTSLCLVGNGSGISRESEERIAQFSGAMPSSLTWLTLDRNAISGEGLRLLAAFLGARCTLQGLAITNSSYTGEEFGDLCRCISSTTSQLRCLDLSSNNSLNDQALAKICKLLGQNPGLKALDLSGNRLGHLVIDALLGAASTPESQQRDVRGEAKVFAHGLVKQLDLLSLARCSLGADCASRLLYALSKGNTELRVLDLDHNHLSNKLARPLVSFLAFNQSVAEFGFAGNEPFTSESLPDLINSLQHNATLRYFRNECAQTQAVIDLLRSNREAHAALERRRNSAALAAKEEEEEALPLLPPHVERLQVLFASPLVFRNQLGELRPLDGLDCDTEKQLLLSSFEEASALTVNHAIGLDFQFGCTTDRLISALTRKPTSLHLSTHGEESYIVLEDGRGGAHALSTLQLKEICESAQVDKFLKLVVVGACSSSAFVAQAFVDAGVANVVGVHSNISDRAAQVFTRAFYLSLAMGDPISLAFELAKQAVRASPACHPTPEEAGKFVLFGNGQDSVFPKPVLKQPVSTTAAGGSSTSLLRKLVPNNSIEGGSFPDPHKWRLTQSKFLEVIVPGRRIDAYLAIVALACKRVVTVVAPEGYGKSATMCGFVCKFLNDRITFRDGAVVLDLAGSRSMAEVHAKLIRLVRKSSNNGNSSSNSILGGEEDEDELEAALQELAKRQCLLALDHVDDLLSECFEEFRFFVGHVLDRTKIRLLIPTRHTQSLAVPGHEHLAHAIGPLDGYDSALLFLRNCPHYFNDLHRRDAPLPKNFELGLAKHPLIAQQRGVPKSLVTAASVLTREEWQDMMEEVVEAFCC